MWWVAVWREGDTIPDVQRKRSALDTVKSLKEFKTRPKTEIATAYGVAQVCADVPDVQEGEAR